MSGKDIGDRSTDGETKVRADVSPPSPCNTISPSELDVLVSKTKPCTFRDASGNRRMYTIIQEHHADFNLMVGDQRRHVVNTVVDEVLQGGARFLRARTSSFDERAVVWKEINRDEATEAVQELLQQHGSEKNESEQKRVADACESSSAANRDDATGTLGRGTDDMSSPVSEQNNHEEANSEERFGKKSKIRHREESDCLDGSPHYLTPNEDPIPSHRDTTARDSAVGFLIREILQSLSSAVSAAGLLAYFYSLNQVSNQDDVDTREAMAVAVSHLTSVSMPPNPGASLANVLQQPNFASHAGQQNSAACENAPVTIERAQQTEDKSMATGTNTIESTQELLRSVLRLIQTTCTDVSANHPTFNQNQIMVQVINVLLQAIEQVTPPSAP